MEKPLLKAKIGVALLAASLFLLPLGVLRPNRVSRGISLRFPEVLGIGGSVGAVLILFGLSLYAFRRSRMKWPAINVLAWSSVLLPAALLPLLAQARPAGSEALPAAARISLDIGFWLFLLSAFLIQSTLHRTVTAILLTGLFLVVPAVAGWTAQLSLYKEFLNLQSSFLRELQRHLLLALSSAFLAIIPGVLLGYGCHRHRRSREWILGFVNFFQVSPTLSLLGLIMIPLTALAFRFPWLSDLGIRGIGFAPAFIVLFLYCLLPITANTYAGFDQLDEDVLQSAAAMGMRPGAIFRRVMFPLALPVILSGVRTAVTQNLGNTILAGLIGGGGMGALIFLGLSQSASDMVILGTIPVVILAMIADSGFKIVEDRLKRKIGAAHDSTS